MRPCKADLCRHSYDEELCEVAVAGPLLEYLSEEEGGTVTEIVSPGRGEEERQVVRWGVGRHVHMHTHTHTHTHKHTPHTHMQTHTLTHTHILDGDVVNTDGLLEVRDDFSSDGRHHVGGQSTHFLKRRNILTVMYV